MTAAAFEPLEGRVLMSNTGAPPVLTGSGTPTNFQENGPPVAVDAGLTVTDADGPAETIDGASVTIVGGFDAADDLLAFTPVAGISGSYNPLNGVLTLTGTATVGDYQTALRSVTYDNIDPNAAPDSRTISFSIAPGALYNPETGHFYDFVSHYDILWTEARDDAASQTLFGLQGYLATITSQQENDFAASKLEQTGWIGASDAAVEGDWRWVTGPEGLEDGAQGRLFWVGKYPTHPTEPGAPVNGEYSNWNTRTPERPGSDNEPNNQGQDATGEDYGHMLFDPTIAELGKWNDLANKGPFDPYIPYGYLVEYGGMPGDPALSLSSTTTVNIVENRPPVLGDPQSAATECGNVAEGQTATVSAAFTDPDVLDTHTATIDWGDGTSSPATVTESGGSGSLTGGHVYAAGGIYTVKVTIADDDDATATRPLDLLITGAGVHGGVLQIIGTSGDDQVTVNQQGDGSLVVHASYLVSSPRTYPGAGVSGLYILLCEGNDHGDASAGVTVPAVIDGGEGDDFLAAGPRSLLVGGTGSDRLVGGRMVDVLVAGSLRPSVTVATQLAVAGGSATLSASDVLDDGVADLLTRVSGPDTVLAGTGDKVTGGGA